MVDELSPSWHDLSRYIQQDERLRLHLKLKCQNKRDEMKEDRLLTRERGRTFTGEKKTREKEERVRKKFSCRTRDLLSREQERYRRERFYPLSRDETDARERGRGRCGEAHATERGRKKKKNGDGEEEGFSYCAEEIPSTREFLLRDRTSAVQEKWRWKRGEGGERMRREIERRGELERVENFFLLGARARERGVERGMRQMMKGKVKKKDGEKEMMVRVDGEE